MFSESDLPPIPEPNFPRYPGFGGAAPRKSAPSVQDDPPAPPDESAPAEVDEKPGLEDIQHILAQFERRFSRIDETLAEISQFMKEPRREAQSVVAAQAPAVPVVPPQAQDAPAQPVPPEAPRQAPVLPPVVAGPRPKPPAPPVHSEPPGQVPAEPLPQPKPAAQAQPVPPKDHAEVLSPPAGQDRRQERAKQEIEKIKDAAPIGVPGNAESERQAKLRENRIDTLEKLIEPPAAPRAKLAPEQAKVKREDTERGRFQDEIDRLEAKSPDSLGAEFRVKRIAFLKQKHDEIWPDEESGGQPEKQPPSKPPIAGQSPRTPDALPVVAKGNEPSKPPQTAAAPAATTVTEAKPSQDDMKRLMEQIADATRKTAESMPRIESLLVALRDAIKQNDGDTAAKF